MQDFQNWWQQRSKSENAIYMMACIVLIFTAGIDSGRALYQATH